MGIKDMSDYVEPVMGNEEALALVQRRANAMKNQSRLRAGGCIIAAGMALLIPNQLLGEKPPIEGLAYWVGDKTSSGQASKSESAKGLFPVDSTPSDKTNIPPVMSSTQQTRQRPPGAPAPLSSVPLNAQPVTSLAPPTADLQVTPTVEDRATTTTSQPPGSVPIKPPADDLGFFGPQTTEGSVSGDPNCETRQLEDNLIVNSCVQIREMQEETGERSYRPSFWLEGTVTVRDARGNVIPTVKVQVTSHKVLVNGNQIPNGEVTDLPFAEGATAFKSSTWKAEDYMDSGNVARVRGILTFRVVYRDATGQENEEGVFTHPTDLHEINMRY